jgi:metal-dependent hydrolase (beta-lactamase superfamily II)
MLALQSTIFYTMKLIMLLIYLQHQTNFESKKQFENNMKEKLQEENEGKKLKMFNDWLPLSITTQYGPSS